MCTGEAQDKGCFLGRREEAESLSHAGNLLEAQKYFGAKAMERGLPTRQLICRLLKKVPVKNILREFIHPPPSSFGILMVEA